MDEILDIIGIRIDEHDENKEHEENEIDASSYLDVFNVFLMYYKGVYNTEKHLFSDINPSKDSSTNKAMELLYEYIIEYKENKGKDPKLIDMYSIKTVDMNQFDELYGLTLKDELISVSPSIYTLFLYVSNTIDWQECKWKITKIK